MITSPDWLTRRGGALKEGHGNTWYVVFDHAPHYRIDALPAQGKYTSVVRQTENGRRIETTAVFDTLDAALKAGLDELGKDLGWR